MIIINVLAGRVNKLLESSIDTESRLSNEQMNNILEQIGVSKYQRDILASEFSPNSNPYFDEYLVDVPRDHKHYEINGDNRCPRCLTGIIVRDKHDKTCLCCGLRDYEDVSISEYMEEALINWLIDNKPRQLFIPPKLGGVNNG